MSILKKKSGPIIEEYLESIKALTAEGYTITDTHTHIHFNEYKNSIEDVLNRADSVGIKRIITVGINFEDSKIARQLAETYNNVFFAVGVHPNEVNNFDVQSKKDAFDELILHKKCLAIGEIGLDFYRNILEKDKQIEVFKFFLNKAKLYNKPIIIHTRNATNDCIKVLNQYKGENLKGVFHCFSGDKLIYDWALNNNFYLSFAGNVTYEKATVLRDVLKDVPISKILIETDCPYLTPMPFRSKENEPYNVIFTLYTLHSVKNIALDQLMSSLERNVNNLFV